MRKTIIDRVESVNHGGVCYVSLKGMRADLSQAIEIHINDIPSWFGVDISGNSIECKIEAGATIFYERIEHRRLVNPRFTE